MYPCAVPRLWTDTIETHRQEVREAILDAAARLAEEHGVTSVTMSDVASAAGVGRATLYKYFPNVEAVLTAWHQAQITAHLAELEQAAASQGTATQKVTAVLHAYAQIVQQHHGSQIAAAVHEGDHMHAPRAALTSFVTGLIKGAADDGTVRNDVSPRELAIYAISAVQAAQELPNGAAVRRLVATISAGLELRS